MQAKPDVQRIKGDSPFIPPTRLFFRAALKELMPKFQLPSDTELPITDEYVPSHATHQRKRAYFVLIGHLNSQSFSLLIYKCVFHLILCYF